MSESESADDEEPTFEDKINQARQFHAQLDAMKQWALQTAAELEALADHSERYDIETEQSPEELRQGAQITRTVYERIEQGDTNRTKQVNAD